MAGHDNSLERQVLDFYGVKKLMDALESNLDATDSKTISIAIGCICSDIWAKHFGISQDEIASEKNRLQRELYAQLEKDRDGNNAA